MSSQSAQLAEARDFYAPTLARGVDALFEPRRATCPWCGSPVLRIRLHSKDLIQRKPGRFIVEECRSCGHLFQNPRLTLDGLDFYYRDFYDGLGTDVAEYAFAQGRAANLSRARAVLAHTAPDNWLDVGTGRAHFPLHAAEILPSTRFDGLDLSAGVEQAVRLGRIRTGHRGLFPELAPKIAGAYDVVSMHHYLEHTADPRAELDAAAAVLPPGGHLLIELPDPEWRLRGVFGQYWMPWFQPQHLSMVPLRNLVAALTEAGLRPVATERGAAHQASDFVTAGVLLLARMAPDRGQPWSRSPDSGAWRAWRSAVWTLGVPLIVGGLLLDRTIGRGLARRWDRGNAYRVLAVKDDDAGTAGPEALT
jgi:SAM-dependent methyltransferase